MKTKTVAIFDMDGTLADSSFYWDRAAVWVLQSFGVTLDDAGDRALSAAGFYHVPEFCTSRYHLSCTPQTFAQRMDDWVLSRYQSDVLLRPGARQYLQSLCDQGVRCVLLTASKQRFIDTLLRRFALAPLFCSTYSAASLGMEKGRPEIYARIFSDLHCTADECVLFDDAPYAAHIAKALGICTVGILDPLFPNQHEQLRVLCTRTVSRYEELPPWDQY